jgi:Cation transport protein
MRRRRTSFHETPHVSQSSTVAPNGQVQAPQSPRDNRHESSDDLKIETIPSQAVSEPKEGKDVWEPGQGSPAEPRGAPLSSPTQSGPDHITFDPSTSFRPGEMTTRKRRNSAVFNFTGVGASPLTTLFRRPGQPLPDEKENSRSDRNQAIVDGPESPGHHLNFLTSGVTGRNSQFYGLTLAEREHLGGVEYRAITFLSWIVPTYFVVWQFLGCLSLGAWMAYNAADTTQMNGINPWYAYPDQRNFPRPNY